LDRRLAEQQNTKSLYLRRKVRKLNRRFRRPTRDSPQDNHYSWYTCTLIELEVKLVKFGDDTKGGKVTLNMENRDKLQRALGCLCDSAERRAMSFSLAKC
jgi:hypothetical protein